MQYSPKLKKAAEEIKEILLKYDIAANVILHTPGFSEYLLHLTPTYSCAWIENGDNGNEAMRNQKIADTLNMFRLLSDTSGHTALALLRKNWSRPHGRGTHRSHNSK